MFNIYIFDPGNFVPDYNYSLCKSLQENNFNAQVTLFSTNKKNWSPDELGFNINSLFFKLSSKLKLKNRLLKKIIKGIEYPFNLLLFLLYVLKNRAEVIHVQWSPIPLLDIIVFYILKLMNFNLVYTVHNILPHEKKWYDIHIYGILYKIFNKLVIHTESNKQEFISIYGQKFEKNLYVIPHGDFKKMYLDNCDELISEVNSSDDKQLKFLFFGLIREYKGLDVLLNTLVDIKDTLKDNKVIFKIYGNPRTDFSKYQKIIDDNSLNDYLEMRLEFIPDKEINDIFKNSDVLILPYKKIYQSGVALLGYTFNLPLIVSDIGGISEIVDDNKSGFIFPPNDINKLGEILKKIIENPDIINNMKNYIKGNISQKYSWDRISIETISLYKL